MKINIIAVGKLKKELLPLYGDYVKMISKFCAVNTIEIKEEPLALKHSQADISNVVSKEGLAILKQVGEKDFVIALSPLGVKTDSPGFAKIIDNGFVNGQSTITFIIGGSNGLSDEVYNRANKKLSFSDLTFPHQLFKIMLVEQIFRAFKISRNEVYHK